MEGAALLVDEGFQVESAVGLESGEASSSCEQGRQVGAGGHRRSLGAVASALLFVGAVFYSTSSSGSEQEPVFDKDGLIEFPEAHTTCGKVFRGLVESEEEWGVGFFSLEFKDNTATPTDIPFETVEDALKLFKDSKTQNIQIFKTSVKNACAKDSRNLLWFYPNEDHNGAFSPNRFVCGRVAEGMVSADADCINIYRVDSPQDISAVLDTFVHDNTVVHAVIGGHGSPSEDETGALGLGPEGKTQVMKNDDTTAMLEKLGKALVNDPTIMVDSCYSGMNSVAKFVSSKIPRAWVMGGVVSLSPCMNMLTENLKKDGPPRIVTDYPGSDKNGLEIGQHDQAVKLFQGGKDMGMVSEWGAPAVDPHPEVQCGLDSEEDDKLDGSEEGNEKGKEDQPEKTRSL